MIEKHIRIDKEGFSTPIWFSDDGETFINGDIDELPISKDLKESLEYYDKYYNLYRKKDNCNINDPLIGKYNNMEDYVTALALEVKAQLKDHFIYIWDCSNLKNKKI